MESVNYTKLTSQERRAVRNGYVKYQNGKCFHCGHPLEQSPPNSISSMKINKRLFPENFFKYPVHLHHNHLTHMTIGAVHSHCNAVLWQYHGK